MSAYHDAEVRALARSACASKEPCEYHLERAAAIIAARLKAKENK